MNVLGWISKLKYAAMCGILFLCGVGLPIPEEVTLVTSGLLVGWKEADFFLASGACILGILAGAIALAWPGITALAFIYLLAAWAILTGILELIAPLAYPMSGGRGVLTVLSGLVSIVFGILIAAQPSSGLLAVVWLIGVYAILVGISYMVVYFQARSVASSLA